MKKLLLCLSVLTCLLNVSCSNDDENEQQDRKPAIVSVLKGGNDFWRQIAGSIESECQALGYTPIISFVNNDGDIDGQLMSVAGISELEKNYDIKGIIYAPIYTEDNHQPEEKLAEIAGSSIPVVIIDSPVDEKNNPLKDATRAFVGIDNKEAGTNLAYMVKADADDIFSVRLVSSMPTVERYNGFCEEKGAEVPLWEIEDKTATAETFNAALQSSTNPDAENIVFFNGSVCLDLFEGLREKNVYTFDAYESFFRSLMQGECVKGIIAQNTFAMGSMAVDAVINPKTEKNILVPTLYITRETIHSEEVVPFFEYFRITERPKETVLMFLGSYCDYWNEVERSAREYADENDINLKTIYRNSDTDYSNLIEAAEHLDTIMGLRGVIVPESDIAIDEALLKNHTVRSRYIAIDATPMYDSPLRPFFSACVTPDNYNMGKEIATQIPETKVIAMSFGIGGSVDRADGIMVGKGMSNVFVIKAPTAEAAADSLEEVLASQPGEYEAVVLTTGNFVTDRIMTLAQNMSVYTVDTNENVEKYLASGKISFTTVSDTEYMGKEAVKCLMKDESDYHVHSVPYTFRYLDWD